MHSLWMLSKMELRLFFREKQAVFWTFAYPLTMLGLFGVMFGQKSFGAQYSDLYVPSWIGVNSLSISLFTIGTVLTSYRERDILKRYQATPASAVTVLGAQFIPGVIILLFSGFLMVLEGKLFFHLSMPKSLGFFLLFLALSVFALFPFGLLLSSLVKNTRTAAALSSVVLNLMLLFSGATFPLTMFPHFLQQVAKILPLYYVIKLLQDAWNQRILSSVTVDVIVLLGIGILCSALSAKFFKWQAE